MTGITDVGDGPFYINYSVAGEHYMIGPYSNRRFAMTHMDDVRQIPGAYQIYLGKKPPQEKQYRHSLSVTWLASGAQL
jgi:hypothetical protein